MRDLSELEAEVKSHDSRPHFREAVQAYRAGAYRACIVETWVAITLDLMSKISRMADEGEGEAIKKRDVINKAFTGKDIKKQQDAERNVLDWAKELGILDERQHKELKRIKDDRNASAHPTTSDLEAPYSPSSEVARAHLATAVDCALGLPGTIGRAVVDRFMHHVNSGIFPTGEKLNTRMRERYYDAVRPANRKSLVTAAVKLAIECDVEESGDVDRDTLLMRYRGCVTALYHINDELVKEVLVEKISKLQAKTMEDDETILRFIGAVGHLECAWREAGEAFVDQAEQLLKSASIETLMRHGALAGGLPEAERLHKTFESRVSECTTDEALFERLLATMTSNRASLLDPCIAAMEQARNFRAGAAAVARIQPIAEHLTADHIARIGKATRENDQVFQAFQTPYNLQTLVKESCHGSEQANAWLKVTETLNDKASTDLADDKGINKYAKLLEVAERAVASAR